MQAIERRRIETFVLSRRLAEINAPENLQFLAQLIQDHDHLSEVILTEPNRAERHAKFCAMVPYLRFEPAALDWYELPKASRTPLLISKLRY